MSGARPITGRAGKQPPGLSLDRFVRKQKNQRRMKEIPLRLKAASWHCSGLDAFTLDHLTPGKRRRLPA
jgi:hypothetical protein